MLGAFYELFIWNFKKSGISRFLWQSHKKDMPVFFISVHGKVSTGGRRVLARHYRLLLYRFPEKKEMPAGTSIR